MPKIARQLSEDEVAEINEPGFWAVGGVPGLHLHVSSSKSWVMRTMNSRGKRCDIGLGGYQDVSLSEARARGARIRKAIADEKFARKHGTEKATTGGHEMAGDTETDKSPITPGAVYVAVGQLSDRFGVSVPTIWRWAREGDFPKPVRLSDCCTRWKMKEILEWEESRERCK